MMFAFCTAAGVSYLSSQEYIEEVGNFDKLDFKDFHGKDQADFLASQKQETCKNWDIKTIRQFLFMHTGRPTAYSSWLMFQ